MNILVCVKQVPDTNEIKIDPVTNTLIRAGVPSIVNTFDSYALEMAARLKDETGGTVTALSMGPDQAKEALRQCLSVGADRAYLVSDRLFGGSDTLATSYILSRAIAKLEAELGAFDLIFCGKQAIDGDTAQVGPEIAEHLGRGQATYLVDIHSHTDAEVVVKKETDVGYELLAVQRPAVLTVTKTAYEPRYPNVRSKLAAARAEIPVLTAEDLELDRTRIGLKGSPTKVRKTFTPNMAKKSIVVQGETSVQLAANLVGLLSESKVI